MSVERHSTIKNDSTLNLANNEIILNDFRIIKITNDINEITLTSNGEICKGAIVVKPRTNDLTINIEDLKLHSIEHIAIDFRSGKECSYKNYLHFKGDNVICSDDNIAICVGNNQTLEIYGEDDSKLKSISGVNMPVIGTGKYSAGSGNVIFSKKGDVVLEVGKNNIEDTKLPWQGRDGIYALGFYNEDSSKASSIRILDEINLKAVGEDGQDIKSISSENSAGNGGSAIYLNSDDYFEKSSKGMMELIGGNGGKCIGEYSSGKCGDGGAAIKILSGKIIINEPAILKGGSGGSIDENSKCILSPGGNGGDGIIALDDKYNDEQSLEIVIEDNVEIIAGNGGNSGFCMNDEGIKAIDGGNGGNIINGNKIKVELKLGKIKSIIGYGGQGGCAEEPCNPGEDGKEIIGENIVTQVNNREILEDDIKEGSYDIDQEKIEKLADEEIIYEDLDNEEKDQDLKDKENLQFDKNNEQKEEGPLNPINLEEVYNEDNVEEMEKERIIEHSSNEPLSGEIIEQENGLEIYIEEKKPNFIIRFFRWLFGRS